MKKSVIILIAIIYIASIAVVSFFGLKYKVFEEEIFVEEIRILNDGLKENDVWGKYVVIRQNENGEWRYQIQYRVLPDDATNKKIKFAYDQQSKATVTDDGIVTFSEPDMVTVELVPLDGSDVSTKITIIAR